MRARLLDGLLVLAVVALVAVPLAMGSDTEFGGADGVAAEAIEAADPGFAPWATPLFEPAAETASGLFALQAALGAGVLGYALGVARTRRRAAGPRAAAAPPTDGT